MQVTANLTRLKDEFLQPWVNRASLHHQMHYAEPISRSGQDRGLSIKNHNDKYKKAIMLVKVNGSVLLQETTYHFTLRIHVHCYIDEVFVKEWNTSLKTPGRS